MKYDGFELGKWMDDETLDEMKRTVVIDVDAEQAEKKFQTVKDEIQSLKKAFYDLRNDLETRVSIGDTLSKTLGNARNIIHEKLGQLEQEIQASSQKIAENMQNMGKARSGSGMAIALQRENESIRKQIAERLKLQAEYKKEEGHIKGTEKGLTSANTSEDDFNDPETASRDISKFVKSIPTKDMSAWITLETEKVISLEAELEKAQQGLTAMYEEESKYDASAFEEQKEKIHDLAVEAAITRDVLSNLKGEAYVRGVTRQQMKNQMSHRGVEISDEEAEKMRSEQESRRQDGTDKSAYDYVGILQTIRGETEIINSKGLRLISEEEKDRVEEIIETISNFKDSGDAITIDKGNLEEAKEAIEDISEAFLILKARGAELLDQMATVSQKGGDTSKLKEECDAVIQARQLLLDAQKELISKVGEAENLTFPDSLHSEIERVTEEIDKARSSLQDKKINLVSEESIGQDIERIQELETRLKELQGQLKIVEGAKPKEQPQPEAQKRSMEDVDFQIWKDNKELAQKKSGLVNSKDIDGDLARIKELEAELKQLQAIREQVYGKQPNTEIIPIHGQDVNNELAKLQGMLIAKKMQLPISLNAQQTMQEIADIEKRIKELQNIKLRMEDEGNLDERIQSLQEYMNMLKSQNRTLAITDQIKDAEAEMKRLLGLKQQVEDRKTQEEEKKQEEAVSYKDAKKRQKELPREIAHAKTKIIHAEDADEAIKKVKELEAELQHVNSIVEQGEAGSFGAQLSASFASLGGHLKNAVGGAIKGVGNVVKGIASGFAQATASVVKFQVAVGKVTFNAIAQGAQMALQGIKTLANGAYQATSALTNFGAQGIGVLVRGASAGAQGMAKLATGGFNLLKKGAESAKNAMQGLVSKFTSLGGHTSKNLLKSLTSIKSMLKRRVKRTFISAIFNQAKEGMQQLAKFDAGFNSAMSNIKNSSKQAAGNLAVTMGNIVQMIAPAIEWLLNLLSSVFEKINAVFALLGGKSTVKTAKKGTDDYAKSLKSAGGAAKDLNKQLYGFDELTRQEDNSSSGGGSKIGYEDKNVADILDDRMKAIMDAIQNGQWEKAGELVGKALSDVVKVVDEKLIEFRPIAKQWAKNIAEFGNGFVKGFDWALLGKTIGDGLNLVMDTLNTFLTTFDFKALGDAFATGVNSIFDTVEWDLLGETLANGYNAVWRTMEGFVSKANWAKYGKSFAQAVDSFAKNIDFTAISNTISGGLNGISEMLLNFATDLDLTETMKNLGASITKAIKDIKWNQMGTALGKGISDLFADFNTLMEAIDFVALGNGLADGIMGIFDAIDWETLGTTFGTYYNKIFDGLLGFVEKIDFDKIAKDLTKGINGFINKIDWSKLKTALTTGINKLIPALRTIITGVDWTKLATDLATNINGVITGINWKELGETLGTGVNTAFGTIKTFMTTINFEDIGKSLGDGISSIISTVNWEEVGSTVASFTNAAFSAISGLATSINWEELGKALSGYLTGLSDSIDWETITTAVTTSVNGLITAFTQIVNSEAIVNLASNLGTTMGNILSEIDWETLATDIGTGIGKLVEAFGNFLTNLNLPDVALKLADGINALFDPEKGGAGFDTALKAVTTGVNSLIKGFANLVGEDGIDFTTISTSIATSINGLIKQTDWATLIETVGGLAVDLTTALWNVLANIEWTEIAQALVDSLNALFSEENQEKLSKLTTTISNALKSIIEGVSTLVANIDIAKVVEGLTAWVSGFDFLGVIQKIVEMMVDAIPQLVGQIPTLVQKLVEFMGQVPWLDIAKAIIQGIGDILVSAAKAVTSLVTSLVDMMKGINWLQVGIAIIQGIAEILFTAVQAVGGVITTIWNAIFGGGEEVTVPQVLSDDVMEQLKQQMGDAGKELANTLNKAIIDNIDDAGSDYEAAKQLFLNSAAEIALGHQAELEKTLREQNVSEATIASLTQQTQDIFNACKPSDATIDDIKSTFRNSGIWICDELAQAFVGQGSENIGLALQLMALGVDQKTIAALDMTHLNENMTAYMNESGATIEEIAGTLGANVGTKIGGTVPEFINKALEEGKATVAETAKEIQEVADTSASQVEAGQNASATGEAITDNLAEGMDGTKTSTKAEAVKKTIDDKIAELPEAEQANAKAMMDMMVQGIMEGDPLVQTAIENSATAVVDKVKGILAGSEGKKIVNTFLSGMKTAINSNFDLTVKNPLATLSGQAINAVALRLNYDNGYTIMYNVLQGMYDAVANGNGQAVVDIFTQVAQALIDTVKAILGIHSPSRVFNEIGAYTMQGMEDGLLSSGDNAIDTVANIVDQMINEGSGVELDASFSAVSSGLDVATDKLSRIADIFSGIADTLVQMGGLQVPTIATGQTIPYRTQLEAMPTASQTAMSDPHALEDAIYSAFTRAIGNTEDDRQVNITLQIDGRKMADIVSKYQRQQSRAWGV